MEEVAISFICFALYVAAAILWYRAGVIAGRRKAAVVMDRWIREGRILASSEFIKEIEGRE